MILNTHAVPAQTTSALEILQQAPKVRIDDPTPVPMPQQPSSPPVRDSIPYRPPAGPAPYVEPAYPAITPYNGNTVGGTRQQPDYSGYQPPPIVPPRMSPPPGLPESGTKVTPTPSVLGPEDVGGRKEKKRGFVRGLINAIPFVGDDNEEDARFTPVPTQMISTPPPMVEETFSDEQSEYRGYDPAAPQRTEPLLLAPGSAPVGNLPPDPTPSSPPIMTPTPRAGMGTPVGPVEPANLDEVNPDRPVLTVKREGEETSPTIAPAAVEESSSGVAPKQPSVSGESDEVTVQPRSKPISPLDVRTTSVTIEEVPPRALSPEQTSPTPASDLDNSNGLGPDASIIEEPVPVDDMATSLTVEQSDLGMPNPTYEQNTVILAEFQAAVRKARAEDYESAAQLFREYGFNHPSSGLAPRAFFLSIVFEKNRAKARESVDALERLFPESNYVKQAAERRPDVIKGSSALTQTAVAVVTDETPRQKIDRLEKELTAAVGDIAREPGLRRQLGETYLAVDENDRAWEVLSPAAEMTAGTTDEGPVLVLLARAHMARGEVSKALSILDVVEQKYPSLLLGDAKAAWSAGLAFEAGARYAKARAIYNSLRQKWPDAQEARWAELRLRELAALSQ